MGLDRVVKGGEEIGELVGEGVVMWVRGGVGVGVDGVGFGCCCCGVGLLDRIQLEKDIGIRVLTI